ncbi:putative MarR-family transcriptional regulator [Streptomyces ambofaciens ATCC 23877]|uniref:MarR family transcriptional regulator n=2 Tax=Streptomyces ambofaciens TaxID=1889 RepID=A0ABM6B7A4_STRAM|nr:MarR family winged helix-turn-helix transcriptional regulator [Streptomyces ambofaciens]AKZ59556.1 putative MarR-family transcriptional regulator [Streptomyces ambofaciens ATCC 23877]ANB09785.1 MarR family transcriptional regulator [Streptomyces ambofaciens]CAJ88769.1 putative MarR-family transcriptional regulator [Streptomyces ambofaciens ATCC 23877]
MTPAEEVAEVTEAQEAAQNLPLLLAGAKRWFDDALTASMRAAGEQPLSSAQGQVFALLDAEGTTVAELARRLGVTRQTAHQAVHGLLALGLLEQVPDPASARNRLIRITAEGARVHRRAQATLAVVEEVLSDRIGVAEAAALRAALTLPRGEPPVVAAP